MSRRLFRLGEIVGLPASIDRLSQQARNGWQKPEQGDATMDAPLPWFHLVALPDRLPSIESGYIESVDGSQVFFGFGGNLVRA